MFDARIETRLRKERPRAGEELVRRPAVDVRRLAVESDGVQRRKLVPKRVDVYRGSCHMWRLFLNFWTNARAYH